MPMPSAPARLIRRGRIDYPWLLRTGEEPVTDSRIVIAGAGPAGLAAAYDLARRDTPSVLLEADESVGGLSRTFELDGNRFDFGGHRFFTHNAEVGALWREVLGPELLVRERLSRIYYNRRFLHYPLRPLNAVRGIGPINSVRALASVLAARLRPIQPEVSFADWVTNRFGRVLYRAFFKTYTEKVWGIPDTEINADWAAQRIRKLSLGKAILHALGLGPSETDATLIDRFDYPRLGPGQMYEQMAQTIAARGAEVRLGCPVVAVHHAGGRVEAITCRGDDGDVRLPASHLLSSIPITELVAVADPAPPGEVLDAARSLRYRGLIAVNLVLTGNPRLPDNWIYLHDADVRAGRMQFYRNWSPAMAASPELDPVGLEYFSTVGDDLWSLSDAELVQTALEDLDRMGLRGRGTVAGSLVIRSARAYPVYDQGYAERVAILRGWTDGLANLDCIGRNGQFRYNNMDHAILTGLLAVRRLFGEAVDPWSVNEEAEYVE